MIEMLEREISSLTEYIDVIEQMSDTYFTVENIGKLIGENENSTEFPKDTDIKKKAETKWFRGQASDWELVPSIFRPGRRYDERKMVFECRRRASVYNYNIGWTDYDKWLSIMQHHGLPTRLLDWSESSGVALFFAVRKNIGASFKPEVTVMNPYALNWMSGSSVIPGISEERWFPCFGQPEGVS